MPCNLIPFHEEPAVKGLVETANSLRDPTVIIILAPERDFKMAKLTSIALVPFNKNLTLVPPLFQII